MQPRTDDAGSNAAQATRETAPQAGRESAPQARREAAPQSTRDQAQQAASSESIREHVAELERMLAAERAQHAARAREVEGVVAILRKSLHQLQDEVKLRREESARLSAELEQSRRALESMAETASHAADADAEFQAARADADTAHAEAEALAAELDAAISVAAEARQEADGALARVAALEDDLIVRENELTHAADRIAELETLLAEALRRTTELEYTASIRPSAPPARAPEVAEPVAERPAPRARAEVFEAPDDLIADEAPTPAAPPATPAPSLPPSPSAASAVGSVAAHAAASRRNDETHPSPTPLQDLSFPQVAGLRIERLVEETPAGIVYEARELATHRAVIVRVLPGVLKLLDGKRLDSVLLAKHPNLVAALSFAVCRQGPYLVMERDEGETAAEWVARLGTLPERIALSVILEIARGLRHAAFHGAIHGDLAPDAVLIDVAGHVRVRGVGLRAVLAPNDTAPLAPEFASSERLRGSPAPDVRADIYSLGAVLHFLLSGKAPFAGDRDAILRQHAANALPDVRELRPDVSDETAKLLRRLLASDPDLRPQTWDQLLVELERRVPGRVSTALRGNLSTRVRRFTVANPWVLGAAIGGILLIAGIWRVALTTDTKVADRFRAACVTADKLAAAGDPDEAREVYRRFLTGTGDPDVEREAARRFDELKK